MHADFIMPLIIFLTCLAGLDFKLIKGEKHWFLLCFPLLVHLLFSLCPAFTISAQFHPFPAFHPSSFSKFSGQYQTLSCSTSRICSAALPSRLTIRLPCRLELPSSHYVPLSLHTSVLDSSFSALNLVFITIIQITLLEKTTGSNWRRNRKLHWESGKMQMRKGKGKKKRIKLSRGNSRQNKRKGRSWSDHKW